MRIENENEPCLQWLFSLLSALTDLEPLVPSDFEGAGGRGSLSVSIDTDSGGRD